jgi:hypothetical protein
VTPSDELYDKLASILHQGGLPCRLETQVARLLTESDRMMDNVKQQMNRRVDLTSTDTGFAVREVFIYTGNISQRDPDNPEFIQEPHQVPILSGKCEHSVVVNNNDIELRFKRMILSTHEQKLDNLLQGEKNLQTQDAPPVAKQSFKERLQSLKDAGTVANKQTVEQEENAVSDLGTMTP